MLPFMLPVFSTSTLHHPPRDIVLLGLRVASALLLALGHGVGKVAVLRNDPSGFPDPLGLGPWVSIVSSLATECGASALVALGLCTRLACVPILFTMAVVALVVHRDHSWLQTEPSVLFFLLFSQVAYWGPGKYSLDGALRGRWPARR